MLNYVMLTVRNPARFVIIPTSRNSLSAREHSSATTQNYTSLVFGEPRDGTYKTDHNDINRKLLQDANWSQAMHPQDTACAPADLACQETMSSHARILRQHGIDDVVGYAVQRYHADHIAAVSIYATTPQHLWTLIFENFWNLL